MRQISPSIYKLPASFDGFTLLGVAPMVYGCGNVFGSRGVWVWYVWVIWMQRSLFCCGPREVWAATLRASHVTEAQKLFTCVSYMLGSSGLAREVLGGGGGRGSRYQVLYKPVVGDGFM